MAINKKLIFWNNQSNFSPPTSSTDTTKSVLWQSIVFFKDTKKIWTHGVYFSSPLDTLLSGYSVGTNTALAASDTILGAFGKIQAQLNTKQVSLPDIPDLAGTYTKVTVSAKGLVTAGSNPTTLSGYGITDAYTKTQINGFLYTDTRTITPTTWGAGSMQFGFTSKTLNNVGNWADFIRFGGYMDSTGGRENIILFFKDGFGLRQYQGDFDSASYNHGYVDYWHSGNFNPSSYLTTASAASTYLPLSGGEINSISSTPLVINTSNSTLNYTVLKIGGVAKANIGYSSTSGVFLQSVASSSWIGVLDNNTPYYTLNGGTTKHTLYHQGNFNPSDYLPLSGGYMTLDGIIRKKAFVGGSWSRRILSYENSTASIQASLGAYGDSDSISYLYLGFNAYDSNNLRVYSDKVQFGNSVIYHSGNSNSPSIDWSAKNLTLNGSISGATTITASGDITTSNRLIAGNTTDGVVIYRNATYGDVVGLNSSLTEYNDLRLRASLSDQMFLRTSGNVDIGYSTAQSAKFAVNGSIYGASTIEAATSLKVGGNYFSSVGGYLSLQSVGNEIVIGGSTDMYVNYRAATGGTPTMWYWRAGSASSWANFAIGNLTVTGTVGSSGNITAPTFIGSLSGNATTATNLASINTTFSGTYPMVVNVGGTLYSHTNVTFTGSSGTLTAPIFSGSLSGSADLLDGFHKTAFQQYFHYGTTASNTGYYKINILPATSWMLSFTIRLYQSYEYYDIRISGYNYGANYWHSPKADLLNSGTSSIDIRFGYDSAYNLWIAVPASAYTGLDIIDVTNGYTQTNLDWSNNFSVTNQATLTGTVQATQTVYRPLKYNENASSATILQTTRTIWGQNFNGSGNVSGALSGASTGSFSGDVSAASFTENGTLLSNKYLALAGGTVTGTLKASGQFIFQSSTSSNYREGARFNVLGGWGGMVVGGAAGSIDGITGAWWVARNTSADFVIAYQTSDPSGGLFLPASGNALTFKSQVILHASNYSSYAVSTTYNSTLNSDSRNSRGITRLFRRDSDADYSVQTYWTGSYWRLYGYSGDTAHADVYVGYADSAEYTTKLVASGGLTTQYGNSIIGYSYALTSTTTGLFPAVDNSNAILTINRHSGDYYSQLGFSSNGSIYYRRFSAAVIDTTLAWKTLLDSSNYSSYALPLSGGTLSNSAILRIGDNDGSGYGVTKSRLFLAPPQHTGSEWQFDTYDDATYAYLRIGYGGSNYWQIRHDGNIWATGFNGSGSGLTGTASSLNIGGNAATASKLYKQANWAAGNANFRIPWWDTVDDAAGNFNQYSTSTLYFQPANGALFATSFNGAFNGALNGNATSSTLNYVNDYNSTTVMRILGSHNGINSNGNIYSTASITMRMDIGTIYATTFSGAISGTTGSFSQTVNFNKNTPSGTAYNALGIQVYSSDGSPVGIGFHRGGYTQTILSHEGNGLVVRSGTISTGALNPITASSFIGSLSGNADTSTKVGNSSIWIYPENSNEVNFGGTNTSTSIYFGYRAKDSRAIPVEFIFGGGGTATLKAGAYNEGGVLLSNKYLQLSGGTLTGKVAVPTATRSAGMYGVYDSTKTGHIWSMGIGYAIDDAGAGFGSLYGMAYKHTNNTTGGTMAGGHQIVFANAGIPNAAIGLGGNFWTTGGFIKNGSSDSYVLLAGGGVGLISSLSVASAANATDATNSGKLNNFTYDQFAYRNGGTGYYQINTWIQLNGTYGLYCPLTNGAHFHPNDGSSYGTWEIRGNRGGYSGIYDLYSGVTFGMLDSTGNGGFYRQAQGRWYFYYNLTNACMSINTSTTSSSYGMYVSGGIYSTGNVVAYSDIRKKENIITVENALDKVLKLRGVFYNKKDDNSKTRQLGVIAQEVQEVLPEVVTYAYDIDEYGVSYGNFAGLFIQAIKEQQLIIEKQANEIENLKQLILK